MDKDLLARLLATSFERWTGEPIAADFTPQGLWNLAMPLVAHGTQDDPIFCYGNLAALKLWEMTWDDFTKLPSRRSAEVLNDIQQDRSAFLAKALADGYVRDYSGVRMSATGKRFKISNTILWNVIDAQGLRHGQAALIQDWSYIDLSSRNNIA